MKSGGLNLKRRWTFGLFCITVLCGLTLLSNHFWLEFPSQFFLPLASLAGQTGTDENGGLGTHPVTYVEVK
jgi:hypothetical protein